MKWTVTLSTFCLALAGCNAAGEPGGSKRFSDDDVPFTFEIPAEFTEASVDHENSRGQVIAGAGLSKVDVIAVRRATDARERATRGEVHEVLGKRVTSELHRVPGFGGWVIECQYTPDRADDVRDACRDAVASVRPK